MKDSFSINTRRYAMRKRKWMKAGACALSAVLIMGLYAGPAFAEWIGTGGARAYIINGQVQTGWQQIDGKWYYLNEQGAPQIGWVKDGEKQYFCTASGEMVSGVVWINGKPIILAHQTVERWQRALSVSTEFLIRLKTMAHRSAVVSRDRREALR